MSRSQVHHCVLVFLFPVNLEVFSTQSYSVLVWAGYWGVRDPVPVLMELLVFLQNRVVI